MGLKIVLEGCGPWLTLKQPEHDADERAEYNKNEHPVTSRQQRQRRANDMLERYRYFAESCIEHI